MKFVTGSCVFALYWAGMSYSPDMEIWRAFAIMALLLAGLVYLRDYAIFYVFASTMLLCFCVWNYLETMAMRSPFKVYVRSDAQILSDHLAAFAVISVLVIGSIVYAVWDYLKVRL